jgi:hypothetical protein
MQNKEDRCGEAHLSFQSGLCPKKPGWYRSPSAYASFSTFLQFTGMLDVLERAFESESVRFARLDGTMSTAERQAAIALYEAPNSAGKPVALHGQVN